MQRRYFGTDGIRGEANTEPMTAVTALRVGMAAGRYFIRGAHRHRVLIGKDTRLSGYMIEAALVSGFTAVGMDVILVGPMPTPAVAMLTRSLAREWARKGLAVNALCPGYIETAINDAWWPTEGGQRQLKGFPRRRLMDATDLDEAFLMLTGPAARAITGSVITVDDGQSLPGGG